MNFLDRRIQEELNKLSTETLKITISQGLNKVEDLIKNKPEGWYKEVLNFERTFRVLQKEIRKREEK